MNENEETKPVKLYIFEWNEQQIIYTDLERLKKIHGNDAEYTEISAEDWQAQQIEAGEKAAEERRQSPEFKKIEIRRQLDAIDARYGNRTIRALTLANAVANDQTENQDFKLLETAETEAQQLREELEDFK